MTEVSDYRIAAASREEWAARALRAEERVGRLESQLARVIDALIRKGTDRDGGWGWPRFDDEMREILGEIGRAKRSPATIGAKPEGGAEE